MRNLKIAIHFQEGNNFSQKWAEYCQSNNINYTFINCFDNDIIKQIKDYNYLLWHVDNYSSKDQIQAKNIIQAINLAGVKTYPSLNEVWHYDDKVAQKYLLESLGIEHAQTNVFYDLSAAVQFIEESSFPLVFKLKAGSGSNNVFLLKNRNDALKLTKKMFGNGIKSLDMKRVFLDRYKNYREGHETIFDVLKGLLRIIIGTPYSRSANREKSYVYFQKFYPNNTFDYRIVIIGERAFGLKRFNKTEDFRASGSFHIERDEKALDKRCIIKAFDASEKIKATCMAYDFVLDKEKEPILIELSTHFNPRRWIQKERLIGYFNKDLAWIEEKVQPEIWIIEQLIK